MRKAFMAGLVVGLIMLAMVGMANASFSVSGTAEDVNLFVSLLNDNSSGGTWHTTSSNDLYFEGTPKNWFSFYIYTFNKQPEIGKIKLIVGQNLWLVFFGAYKDLNGAQTLDLADIMQLPQSDPNLFTRGQVLLHEISESFFSELDNKGFDDAHTKAIETENSYLRSIGSNLQHLLLPTRDEAAGMFARNFYFPVTVSGDIRDIRINTFTGNQKIIPEGFADFGGTSYFDTEADYRILGQTLVPHATPLPASILLFGPVLIGLVGLRKKFQK